MTAQGYSDRIHHALAFAAKHHDQQVRRGTRAPYSTRPANAGIILAHYGLNDVAMTAGILHEAVGDLVREGMSRPALDERIGHKFGVEVLDTVLMVTERRADDDGLQLSLEDRRADLLHRLALADDNARWVVAANALHQVGALLADLRRTIDPTSVWSRLTTGRVSTLGWYGQLADRLREVGFTAPIVAELSTIVGALAAPRG